jgi:hypothetical protein
MAMGAPASARAESLLLHPDLVAATATLDRARGSERYAALRGLWDTWSRRPAHNRGAAAGRGPPIPASNPGARLRPTLAAFARLRAVTSPLRAGRSAALGFVNDWLVVGPFDNEGKTGFAVDHVPKPSSRRHRPRARLLGQGAAGPLGAAPADAFRLDGSTRGAGATDEHVCVFAKTFVSGSGSRTRSISAWVGPPARSRSTSMASLALEGRRLRAHDTDRFASSSSSSRAPTT